MLGVLTYAKPFFENPSPSSNAVPAPWPKTIILQCLWTYGYGVCYKFGLEHPILELGMSSWEPKDFFYVI